MSSLYSVWRLLVMTKPEIILHINFHVLKKV